MTVAVFGASGFIGRHLMERLRLSGCSFVGFSHRGSEFRPNIVPIEFENTLSYSSFLHGVTTAVMLITQSMPGTVANRAATEVERNILPYARFVEVALSAGIQHVIFVSSGGTVYGKQKSAAAITEEHPTLPINAYGAGKLMIETMLRSFLMASGINLTILRPGNPVGVEQQFGRHGLLASAVSAAKTQTPLEIWGDGTVVRDYFHVNDLSDAIMRCLHTEAANQIFNVGTGVGTNVNQILNIVDTISPRPIIRRYLPARQVDVPINVLSYEKIERTLGWRPSMDVNGIIQTLWAS